MLRQFVVHSPANQDVTEGDSPVKHTIYIMYFTSVISSFSAVIMELYRTYIFCRI